MSERYEQAAAEAERITLYSEDRDYRHLFMEGVDWADANPHLRTITRDQAQVARNMLAYSISNSEADKVFAALGIEVVDDE